MNLNTSLGPKGKRPRLSFLKNVSKFYRYNGITVVFVNGKTFKSEWKIYLSVCQGLVGQISVCY